MCVCVCVCACVRACVCVCVCIQLRYTIEFTNEAFVQITQHSNISAQYDKVLLTNSLYDIHNNNKNINENDENYWCLICQNYNIDRYLYHFYFIFAAIFVILKIEY